MKVFLKVLAVIIAIPVIIFLAGIVIGLFSYMTGKAGGVSNKIYSDYAPADQILLHNLFKNFQSSYDSQINEIRKSEVFSEANQQFDKNYGNREIKNWVGVVEALTTITGGDVVDSFSIKSKVNGCEVIFNIKSGVISFETIPRNSSLYNQLRELKVGDEVVFNGKIVKETSITEKGWRLSPEVYCKFSSVEKLSTSLQMAENRKKQLDDAKLKADLEQHLKEDFFESLKPILKIKPEMKKALSNPDTAKMIKGKLIIADIKELMWLNSDSTSARVTVVLGIKGVTVPKEVKFTIECDKEKRCRIPEKLKYDLN